MSACWQILIESCRVYNGAHRIPPINHKLWTSYSWRITHLHSSKSNHADIPRNLWKTIQRYITDNMKQSCGSLHQKKSTLWLSWSNNPSNYYCGECGIVNAKNRDQEFVCPKFLNWIVKLNIMWISSTGRLKHLKIRQVRGNQRFR